MIWFLSRTEVRLRNREGRVATCRSAVQNVGTGAGTVFGFVARHLRLAGAGVEPAAARRADSAMTALSLAAMAVTAGFSIRAGLRAGAGRMRRLIAGAIRN